MHKNAKTIYDMLENDFLPIICPIGMDDQYQSYNINADDAACAIAKALEAECFQSSIIVSMQSKMEAAEKLLKASGMDRVFFTNSGTEAIEGALKAARRYSYNKYGTERYEIIAMNHSFHGRSMGALSVTGTEKYRTPFEPLIGGV